MEEDMMMPNVAPAPMMAGTPMGGDLSAPMAPAQAKLDPDEMQQAKGALMQIIQIILMLVNQGLSEKEIQQFLAQYDITEEELDQAAAILGVDIDALMAGQQRMPMAAGGDPNVERIKKIYSGATDADLNMLGQVQRETIPGTPEDYEKRIYLLQKAIAGEFQEYHDAIREGFKDQAAAKLQSIKKIDNEISQLRKEYNNQFSPNVKTVKSGMPDPLAPAPVPKTPEMIIFSINAEIDNLMQEYNMAVRNNEFKRAQAITDQIDGLQQQIINLQESKVPPMAGLNMRFGGSAAGK